MKPIRVTCQAAATAPLHKLTPLQGALKTLPDENYAKLRKSILRHGISFPFFVWKHLGKLYILDGHQRDTALRRLQDEGHIIPPVPIDYIHARNQQEAKRKILLSASQYGVMTDDSIREFSENAGLDLHTLMTEEIEMPFIELEEPDEKATVNPITIKPAPQMAWALVGIPIQHFAKVQAVLDQLPAQAQVHTTSNDET